MAFWRIVGIWVIYGDVVFGQHRPSYVVTRFYGFYPHGLDWISADCVDPSDSLFFGRQVVHAMCHLDFPFRCLRGSAWLPLPVVLGPWDPVSASFIYFADENGLVLTCDEYILLFMYCDALLCEDGNVAIVCCLAHTQYRGWEVFECVCICLFDGDLR